MIKILPDREPLDMLRADLNKLLMRKMNDSNDMFLINQIVEFNTMTDSHINKLESMIIDLQDRVILANDIYNELLTEYGKMSEKEMNMIKWILKKKINGRSNNKE